MSRPNLEHGSGLAAYPNLTEAAAILGVSPSTLSRRADLGAERRGERDLVLSPRQVLRLAGVYRKRSLNEVAQDLIDHAEALSPESRREVEGEVETFFEARTPAAQDRDAFLRTAQVLLPGALYERVEKAITERGESLPEEVTGYVPPED